jgi:AraC-like DNA-binding protein/quercetin dioxygenase-like cupin family protein
MVRAVLNWKTLTPQYLDALSGASLLAQGELFSVGDVTLSAAAANAPHWHDSYELGFVRSGTGIIVLGQQEYAYTPGQVYIINSFDPHMGYAGNPYSRLFVVAFHPTILDDGWIGHMRREARAPFLPDFGAEGPLIPLDDPVTAPVRGLLREIRREAIARATLWDVVAGGLLIQAIGYLARRVLQRARPSPARQERRKALQRIGPILQMIQQRYADPLSLAEMADVIHVSRPHCCALFKTALGTTPITYRNARRLAEARRLLCQTDLTVQEIAYRVGFSTAQEFHRLFRRETGTTPTQFLALSTRLSWPTHDAPAGYTTPAAGGAAALISALEPRPPDQNIGS